MILILDSSGKKMIMIDQQLTRGFLRTKDLKLAELNKVLRKQAFWKFQIRRSVNLVIRNNAKVQISKNFKFATQRLAGGKFERFLMHGHIKYEYVIGCSMVLVKVSEFED